FAFNSTALLHSAALVGLASSLPGLYLALRFLGNEAVHLFQSEINGSNKVRS
nr:hypothetical protein [Gammaproteobacteria bacterium]NIR25610.1 hypothetical protein [Gammaproteobacteria bacterium]